MSAGVVTSIDIYPIKSCRAVGLLKAEVSPIGLAGDRRWQVVSVEGGRGLTQRRYPILATVQPELTVDGGLRITSGELEPIVVDPPGASHVTLTSHFGVPVPGWDAGDVPASWFSELLGEPVRLVAMEHDVGWRPPEEFDVFDQPAAFVDAAPLLVASATSLRWLVERASQRFGMNRFRPNVTIDGTDPWEEDTWVDFTIGEARLRGHIPWPRCAIPQVDQETGERHKEPARVLKQHRWCSDASSLPKEFGPLVAGNALFGLACSVGPVGAVIEVGDVVTVESRTAPLLSMA